MKSKTNIVMLKPAQPVDKKIDLLKWLLSVSLVLAGLIGNHYYSDILMPIRTVGWLLVLALAIFVAAQTSTGSRLVVFFKDSRTELRKVVWPTRKETMHTTLIVGLMVVILAFLLWGVDSVLVRLIGWLTGQIT